MIKQKNNILRYQLFKDEYDQVLKDIMENGYDANGPYCKKVEQELKKITGRKHVFMTNSGTSAILASIYALNLFDKKVAVCSYNYSACVSQYQVLCKPVYIDCDENTLLDIDKIPLDCEAVMLVNYWGNVIDYDKIKKRFHGKIISDCSQSLGAKYKGRNDGYFGDVSIFAFGGQKPIGTRGFTGAIATDDDDLAQKIECILNQGRPAENKKIPIQMLGFRGTPQEIQCGLISVGMKYLTTWQDKRKEIANRIMDSLSGLPIRFIKPDQNCEGAYYKLVGEVENRDYFLKYMNANGIDAQVTYIDNWNKVWGDKEPMPMTDRLSQNTVSFPLSSFFTDIEVETIIARAEDFFKQG